MGFFGDLIGSVIRPLSSIGGGALGSMIGMPSLGSSVGGILGDKVGGLTSKIPFKRGGTVVVQHPNGMIQVIGKPTKKKGKATKKKKR